MAEERPGHFRQIDRGGNSIFLKLIKRLTKYFSLVAGATIMGLVIGLWIFVQAHAQTSGSGGRIDAFTFFIPYPTDILDDQFEVGVSDPPPDRPPSLIDVAIETIISIAVHREGSIIYYDHWEDGLEPNLTEPIQPSTEVWGDNNPDNGIPLGFSVDLLAVAATPQDDVITLRNIVDLPRDRAALFYDGGDMLTSVGGAIAVSLTFWTAPPGPGILFTDAWELYPTNRWGTDYLIPIGENLAGTGANQRLGFEVVGLNVQAVSDNTTVNIDLDANGDFETTITLNQGEQFTKLGTESGLGPDSVLVGAEVQASAPVQVHLFQANPASRYEARGATMVPANQWTDDYLAPRSSDGDFWLFNPHDSDLEVIAETSITDPVSIIIPANSTVKYPPIGLSPATGVRFTSTDERHFYGLATFDEDDSQDWGHALLPFNRLATQALIGLGLGNNNDQPDGDQSRVYVTATKATTIFVDYNNDGGVDATFSVDPLAEVAITDPDHDMTGAFLFTNDNTPFVAVWGQDASADPALPSIDAGTGVVPLPSLMLQKTFSLIEDTDCTRTVTVKDKVQFKLQYFNETVTPVRNVIIVDNLPSAIAYVPNTTLFNGTLISDNTGGSPFPLDETGHNLGEVGPLATGSLIFNIVINDVTLPIVNQASISSEDLPLGSDAVIVFTTAQSQAPVYQINQTLVNPADGFATSGQVITFNLSITNTAGNAITRFPLQDTFNADHLTFRNSIPQVDIINPGQIGWNDLTDIFGDMTPGAVTNLIVSFTVNELPPTITHTASQAIGAGGELSDGSVLPTCSADALVNIKPVSAPPPPPPTPEPPDDPTPTPLPPTPPATPVAANVPVATSTVFPVVFLPETGHLETPVENFKDGIILLGLVLGGVSAATLWLRYKTKRPN